MVVMKKDLVVVVLVTFCLTAALFLIIPIRSSPAEREYDPWMDLDDDGKIGITDLYKLAVIFGTTGEPINKTALLHHLATDSARSGLLLHLPIGATVPTEVISTQAILYSLDLNQNEPGNQQSVLVGKGGTINATVEFQVMARSGEINQAFFIYSWTPSWPPPPGYYKEIWDGMPGPYPGSGKISKTFNIIVPNNPGVYFLHFCFEAMYNIPDAVNQFKDPLWTPYAIILVGDY